MKRKGRPASKTARNERRKALATTFNALSVAPIVTAVLQPALTKHALETSVVLITAVFFLTMQAILHYILGRLED